jgi:hypothetical protein
MEKNSGQNSIIHDLDFGIFKIPKNPKKIPKSQIRFFPLV